MSAISQVLYDIIHARFGKDVRQAIHDGIELGYNIASDAKVTAETAQDSASASATAAANSASAAQTAANNASFSASLAEQYKEEAFHTTPVGYEDFVSETNSNLGFLAETGVKNVLPFEYYSSPSNLWGVNSDGTITLNGTTSVTANFNLTHPSEKYAPPKGIYKWSKRNTNITTVIQAYNGSNTFVKNLVNTASEDVEFTIDYVGYDRLNVYLQISANTTWNNDVLYPMIRPSQSDSEYQSPAETNAVLTNKIIQSLGNIFSDVPCFRCRQLTAGHSYQNSNGYDTVLIIGGWGSSPRIKVIRFNGVGNATLLALDSVNNDISVEVTSDGAKLTCGQYFNGMLISTVGHIYEDITS